MRQGFRRALHSPENPVSDAIAQDGPKEFHLRFALARIAASRSFADCGITRYLAAVFGASHERTVASDFPIFSARSALDSLSLVLAARSCCCCDVAFFIFGFQ